MLHNSLSSCNLEVGWTQESCSSFPSMSHCNFSSSLTYGTFKLWPSCTQIICHMMTWTILQHLQAKHTVASWLYSYLNLFLRNFICRLGASPSDLRSFDIDYHIAVWGWEVLNLSWLMRTMLAYNMHKASEQKQWLSIQAVLSCEPPLQPCMASRSRLE